MPVPCGAVYSLLPVRSVLSAPEVRPKPKSAIISKLAAMVKTSYIRLPPHAVARATLAKLSYSGIIVILLSGAVERGKLARPLPWP
jgi:hypothetical protein